MSDFDIYNILKRQSRQGRLIPGDSVSHASHGKFINLPSFNFVDHVQNLLMLEQYKSDEQLKTLIIGFLRQLNDLEYVILDMKNMLDIEQAYGWWLDIAGYKVGALRNGLSDNDFRDEIKFKIFINRSWGQPNVIMAFAEYITQATDIEYSEDYPAKIVLRINSSLTIGERHKQMIQSIALGGVGVNIISNIGDYIFAFDWEADPPANPRHKGFAEMLNRQAEYYNPYKYGNDDYTYINILNPNNEIQISDKSGVKFPFGYNINSNTRLSVEVALENTSTASNSYFGFELSALPADDPTITELSFFQLDGTDIFGIQDFNGSIPNDGNYHQLIFNIGIYYNLHSLFLCIKNYHDGVYNPLIKMKLRNFKLYQVLASPPAPNGGKYSDWI